MDVATLAIIEDKLLITKMTKKKRRQMTMECPSYVEEEETPPQEE